MKNKTRLLLVLASGLLLASTGLSISSAVQCSTDNDDLQKQNEELIQQIKDKDTEIDGYKDLIPGYEDQLKEYEDIISSMENNVYYTLSYYKDDTLLSSELVKNGLIASAIPQSTNDYYIAGWALEDGTPVDINTFAPKVDTALYAQTDVRKQINWSISVSKDGATVMDGFVERLSQTEFDFVTEEHEKFQLKYPGWTVVGWAYDHNYDVLYTAGDYFELPDGYIQFNAILSKNITATYKVDGEVIKTDNHTINNISKSIYKHYATIDLSVLETPTKEGYTFKGWAIEGAEDTILTTSNILANTTFVAVFEANE